MPAHRELIFAATRPVLEAFLAGLGRGGDGPITPIFNESCGVARESAAERVLEALHLEAPVTHVILPADQAARVARAASALPAGGPRIELRADRAIREAWFDYRFRAFTRRDASAIRRALAALPAGVRAEDAATREERDPSARGAELYAPLHDYVFSGRGRLRGPFAEVLALRRSLGEIAMLEVGEIRLDLDETGGAA
jgi:hypothetical protein